MVAGIYYTPAKTKARIREPPKTKALHREGGISSCDYYWPSTVAQALQQCTIPYGCNISAVSQQTPLSACATVCPAACNIHE